MKVYISYSQADETVAQKLAEALQDEGLEVWYDQMEIMPGENWGEKVAQGLRESEAMIVLLSPQALNSNYVRHDIEYALSELRYRNRLISVVVASSHKIPHENIPWILRSLQLIELTDNGNEAEFKKITQALKAAA